MLPPEFCEKISRCMKEDTTSFFDAKMNDVFKEEVQKTGIAAHISAISSKMMPSLGICAGIAAGLLFGIVLPKIFSHSDSDILSSHTLKHVRMLPPDFDLEGDSEKLSSIMAKYVSAMNAQFAPTYPKQIPVEYKPREGRIFSWRGAPAVSLKLQPLRKSKEEVVLYIMESQLEPLDYFPANPLQHAISAANYPPHAKVWKEAKTSYILFEGE